MGTFIVKEKGIELTEEQLANLYFRRHPKRTAVTSSSLLSWARRYYKSDLIKIRETEMAY